MDYLRDKVFLNLYFHKMLLKYQEIIALLNGTGRKGKRLKKR